MRGSSELGEVKDGWRATTKRLCDTFENFLSEGGAMRGRRKEEGERERGRREGGEKKGRVNRIPQGGRKEEREGESGGEGMEERIQEDGREEIDMLVCGRKLLLLLLLACERKRRGWEAVGRVWAEVRGGKGEEREGERSKGS